MDTETTDVIFRKFPKREGGEVIALFPGLAGGVDKPWECMSYMHIGQHGLASVSITGFTAPARPEEYASLKSELEAEPYGYRLRVVRRFTRKHERERKAQLSAV